MKKILVVYAHPYKTGHNGFILKNVESALKKSVVDYEILDLYKIKFDPVLKLNEHILSKKFAIGKDILKIQSKIKKSDRLIFIHPVWWNSPPAILKGFLDRVFTAKFAFRYKKIGGLGIPIGLLKGKKAVVFVTSGSPRFFFWLFQKSRGKKIVSFDTLKFCGIKSKVWHYDNANGLGKRGRKKIPVMVKKGLNWLH